MEDIRYDGELAYILRAIGFVSVQRKKNFTFPYRNGKDRHSLIMVEEGSLRYEFIHTNETVVVDKGSVIFIPKEFPYVATYLQDDTLIKILVFDMIAEQNILHFRKPIIQKTAELTAIYKSIEYPKNNNTVFLASKIYEILDRMESEQSIIPKRYKKIIPAIEEISRYYYENRKLSYYAELCFMSESNFRKLFKEYTGRTPIEYRNLIRITEVRKLIDSGEYTVQEAAYLVGFNNMSFFYETLRKSES
ncbi:MAG: helix-turn-helix transcriptional regulator [Clostridia bacterium]|nr:helix-turn-helix transcriptional regulator [Clostridia bacterium]